MHQTPCNALPPLHPSPVPWQAFGTQYLDPNGQLQPVHQTSWGVSTRMIGGIIMAHGDDKGLRLPPRIAPVQVCVWGGDKGGGGSARA